MSELEAAKAQADVARKRVLALEQEEFDRITLPAMRERIGFCYRYRNSYSCPQTDADYWWMYVKITGVIDGAYQAVNAQKDSYGKVSVETHQAVIAERGGVLSAAYQPMSRADFEEAIRRLHLEIRVAMDQ
jgi:hypothetical protein